ASQLISNPSFGPGEKRHCDQRNDSKNNSSQTGFRNIPADQIHGGFIPNVDRQPKETYSYNFQRKPFVPFPAVNVRVDRHAPQYGDTRRYFNKTINTKPNQRDAAGNRSRHNRHQAFQGVPGNGEIFQALSASRY